MSDANPFALDSIQQQGGFDGLPPAGNTPPPADDGNPYSLPAIAQAQRVGQRAVLQDAVRIPPEQASEAERLGQRYNVPAPVAQRNLRELQLRAALDDVDAKLNTSPALAATVRAQPALAPMIHDDVNVLATIEKKLGSAAEFLGKSAFSGALSMNAALLKLADTVNPFTLSEGEAATLWKDNPEAFKQWQDSAAGSLTRWSKIQQAGSEFVMGNLSDDAAQAYGQLRYSTLEEGKSAWRSPIKIVGDALQSLPSSIALGVSAYLSKGAATRAYDAAIAEGMAPAVARVAATEAAAQSMAKISAVSEGSLGYAQQALQTASESSRTPDATLAESAPYKEALAQGFTPATARALVTYNASEQAGQIAGIVDAAVNYVGGEFLGRVIGEGGKTFAAGAKGALIEAATEGLQSPGEQFGQNWAQRQWTDPGQDLGADVLESALQGIAVGGATRGAISAAGARAARRQMHAEQAADTSDSLAELFKTASESKLRERDPATFAQTVQSMAEQTDGALKSVHIDAQALAESVQAAGLSEEVFNQMLPSAAAQMGEALATNGTIELPIGEVTASIPGSPLEQAFIENVRSDPTAPSLAETKAGVEQGEAEVKAQAEKIIAEADDAQRTADSADAVRQNILDQLTATKRFSSDVMRRYADLHRAFFTVLGHSMGVMPEEAYAKYPLRITSQIGRGETLNQGEPVVKLDGSEIAPAGTDLRGLVAAAREMYRGLQAKGAVHPDLGGIKFTKTGWEHLTHTGADPRKWRLIPALRDIVERATLVDTKVADKARSDGLVKFHWLEAPVELGGEALRVGVQIGEDAKGRKFFNLNQDLGQWADKYKTPERVSAEIKSGASEGLGGAPAVTQEAARGADKLKQSVGDSADGINLSILHQDTAPRGTFSPARLEISLLADANLSTFLHESGHFYLEVLADVASQPDAPPQMVADMNAALAWFGIKADKESGKTAAEVWQDMTLDQQRPYHEKWAEAFERYLLEGKAPSVELRGAFQRFREFMLGVYKSLKEFLREKKAGVTGDVLGQGVAQTETPEFKRWFGDSKVVDSKGKPLVVYHGAPDARFVQQDGVFKSTKERLGMAENDPERAFFFAADRRTAATYADDTRAFDYQNADPGVVATYLALQNPMVIDHAGQHWHGTRGAVERARAGGHDGVIIKNVVDDYNTTKKAKPTTVYIAFNPEQIKSATGNRGTFDPNDPNILRQDQTSGPRESGLNDEIRRVFDRLLATQEQIAEAEHLAGFEAIYKSAEDAGMTPEQWSAYQAKGAEGTADAMDTLQARSMADLKWTAAAHAKALREAQAAVKEKRDAVLAEVTAEVRALPVEQARAAIAEHQASTPEQKAALKAWNEARAAELQRAMAELTAKLLADNPDAKGIAKGQLLAKNRKAIANQAEGMAIEWERANPRPQATPSVTDLEFLAESLGYTSADHLRRDMLESPKARDLIEGMTDQRLLERYGELVTPAGIAKAAAEAVHNEARGRFVATELTAMQKALAATAPTGNIDRRGRPMGVNVIVQAARTFAENVVNGRRIGALKPAQHTAAEARAGARAIKLLAEGKTAEAIAAKRDQVLNHYTAMYAFRAEKTVERQLEYLKRFDKESTRKALPADYLDQIDALLERFDLRKSTTGKEIERRASLAKWVEQQHEMGLDPVLPPGVLDDAKLTSYKQLTVEQFAGLVDSVKNIEHLARLKSRLLKAKDRREFEAIAGEIARTIVEHGGKARPTELESGNRVVKWFRGAWAEHRKLGSLVHQMDGADNGPFYRAFVRTMNESGTQEAVRIEQATKALADIYKPILALPGGTTGAKLYIPEIKNSLSRGGRLAVALNWGNPQNQQRLMDQGRDAAPWTPAQVAAILRTLSPTELKFVNDIWAHIDSYWPDIKAKQERVSGVVEQKVEAVPFEATANDGTVVPMRGGYYPIAYNPERSDRSGKQQAEQLAKDMLAGAIARPSTRRGHTKARVEEVRGRPLRLDLNVITQHVTQVVHDLAWHEWFIDANRLLNDPQIVGAIKDHYGNETLKTMRDDVAAIAVGDIAHQSTMDQLMLKIRSSISRSVMGLSMTSALMQPFGLTQSMARIGVVPVLKGAARWAGDATQMQNTMAWIGEKSDFMRLRSTTFNREIHEISQRVKGKSKAMQIVDASLFMAMQKMQLVADVPTWVGQYEKSLNDGLDEAAAVAMADEAVLASQGGGQTKDLAQIQRDHPFLTQFYSYFSTTLNLVAEKTAMTDFKNPRAVAGWLADMALLVSIPAILPSMLTFLFKGGGDDDPDKWATRLLKWQAGYMFGMLVGVRELAGAVDGFSYSGPPVGRIISDAASFAQQVKQGDLDEAAVAAFARLMGDATGAPMTQLMRSWKGWQAWDDGQAPPTSILFGPPPRD